MTRPAGRVAVRVRRGREGGIEDRSFRNDDLEGLDHALIVGDVRVDHLQKSQHGRRGAGSS